MFKKLLVFVFIFSSSAHADIINKLTIIGNNRISEETIKVYGEIEIGKDYSSTEVNQILKNLYNTNFFENIIISINNGVMNISVKEYSVINSIIINGEKSKTLTNLILERIYLKKKESFIESKLNADINLIKKFYSSAGFNFIEVDAKIERFSENRINILYDIKKGKKTYINTINFIGNKIIRSNKLKDIIVSEENKFWKVLSKNTFFSEQNIELDKRLLLNYYKSLGYYDVQVLSNSAAISDGKIDLTFSINAGTRYRINKISTNVENIIDKKLFESLEDNYIELIGKYYSPFKVKKLLDSVDLLIANNDLQFVEHSVREILEEDNINIVINIYEGKKEVVEKINVYGNTITNETVIRSELSLDEGDPFSNLKLDQSIAKLKSRNIFGDIKTNIDQGSNSLQKIINIDVEEKPTGEISAGAGIGTNGGSLSFNVVENNWLGEGINVSTYLELSKETFIGGFSANNPNYNFSGNALNFNFSNTKNDKPNSGYKNNIFTTGVGTRFEQYKDIYISPSLNFSYDNLKVDNTASSSLKKQKGAFSDLNIDYTITNDKRDRSYGPTDGYITNFTQTLPIFADSPYIKNAFSFNKYKSFSPNIIGAFKLYGSAINGLKGEDIRLSKRLSLSSYRLRGFEAGKIGPKDGNDYVGGNYTASSSFEVNLPTLLPESTQTDIGVFLDVGNIWHVDYDNTIDDSNKIRSTLGVSADWKSPIGPMSFILSENLSKADTDITESFNFRIGTSF